MTYIVMITGLTLPSLPTLSSPADPPARLHLQEPQELLHKSGPNPNHSDHRQIPAAAGGECPVRGRAAELTCVRWRAAAPRLRSQLPSTSSCTRTLGRPTGQQLLFHQSLWSVHSLASTIIIIEKIAVIFLRCRHQGTQL